MEPREKLPELPKPRRMPSSFALVTSNDLSASISLDESYPTWLVSLGRELQFLKSQRKRASHVVRDKGDTWLFQYEKYAVHVCTISHQFRITTLVEHFEETCKGESKVVHHDCGYGPFVNVVGDLHGNFGALIMLLSQGKPKRDLK